MLENQVNSIFLGIGSNLGNRKLNIEKAKFRLIQNNILIVQTSSYYESLSWPNPDNPKFLNIVLKIKSNLNALELLKKCKEIERYLGRKKSAKNSPRECDIDIIDYDQKIFESYDKKLILPHPRICKRNFVLLPLLEINRSWKHPIYRKKIVDLVNSLPIKDLRSIKQI